MKTEKRVWFQFFLLNAIFGSIMQNFVRPTGINGFISGCGYKELKCGIQKCEMNVHDCIELNVYLYMHCIEQNYIYTKKPIFSTWNDCK